MSGNGSNYAFVLQPGDGDSKWFYTPTSDALSLTTTPAPAPTPAAPAPAPAPVATPAANPAASVTAAAVPNATVPETAVAVPAAQPKEEVIIEEKYVTHSCVKVCLVFLFILVFGLIFLYLNEKFGWISL